MGWDTGGEEDVAANGAAFADNGVSAEDGRAWVDRHIIFDRGMAFAPAELHDIAGGLRAERHAVVYLHVIADDAGFSDDGPGAVVDKEMRPDLRAGMQIHSR